MKVERGYFFPNRTRALAGFIKCRYCGGEVVQVSAKDRECYGCQNAKKESCDNTLLMSGRGVETVILNDLKEKFLTTQGLKCADKLALKDVLEMTELKPLPRETLLANGHSIKNCSYYVGYTSIQTLSLLDEQYKAN